jgi:hypothetical protein
LRVSTGFSNQKNPFKNLSTITCAVCTILACERTVAFDADDMQCKSAREPTAKTSRKCGSNAEAIASRTGPYDVGVVGIDDSGNEATYLCILLKPISVRPLHRCIHPTSDVSTMEEEEKSDIRN